MPAPQCPYCHPASRAATFPEALILPMTPLGARLCLLAPSSRATSRPGPDASCPHYKHHCSTLVPPCGKNLPFSPFHSFSHISPSSPHSQLLKPLPCSQAATPLPTPATTLPAKPPHLLGTQGLLLALLVLLSLPTPLPSRVGRRPRLACLKPLTHRRRAAREVALGCGWGCARRPGPRPARDLAGRGTTPAKLVGRLAS
jgi:hypothetical protein